MSLLMTSKARGTARFCGKQQAGLLGLVKKLGFACWGCAGECGAARTQPALFGAAANGKSVVMLEPVAQPSAVV